MQHIRQCLESLNERLVEVSHPDRVDGVMSDLFGNAQFMQEVEAARSNSILRKELKCVVDESCIDIFNASGLLKHSRAKPFGYPGDFIALEHIYNQKAFSSSTSAGKAIDEWALSTSLPTAVRQRKNALCYLLDDAIISGKRKFLSIGAGTAREIRDLNNIHDEILFDLLDHDAGASHAFRTLTSLSANFHVLDVLTAPLEQFDGYDLIYSFGLIDYLPDKIADKLLRRFTPLLGDNGLFVFSLKDTRFYNAWFYDVFCEWRFVDRVADDGPKMAERAGLSVVKTLLTENKAVKIFICRKID